MSSDSDSPRAERIRVLREKLAYLEVEEAKLADDLQKFQLKTQIHEIRQ